MTHGQPASAEPIAPDPIDRAGLAARLAAADDVAGAALLSRFATLADIELARALKSLFDENESSDPALAGRAAAALERLAKFSGDPEVCAWAEWTAGMAAQLDGRMEESIANLDAAEAQFLRLGHDHTAAATLVSKLFALAILGRYEQAIACGLRARDVFLAHNDLLAAGKIDQNLGNIYGRRERHAESEQFFRAARERFLLLGDQKQLAQIENCLATALMFQHQFRAATQIYQQALARAEAAELDVTHAEIECNLGNLALFQGRYDAALDYLERSRRRYAALGMPHETAIAEQELADAYLELNLTPEAAEIYARVIPVFADLGMRAEQARALANYGHACLLLGQAGTAQDLLAEARTIYAAEGNTVGEAMITLAEAQISYAAGDHIAAREAAAMAEAPLAAAGTWGRALQARWLRGEAARALNLTNEARTLLVAALHDAEQHMSPQVAQRCHSSLGLLAAATGDPADAETAFKQALRLIEELRAPLPAEEFRTAFLADKLTPYAELVRLCLAADSAERSAEALGYVERARSRALMERLGDPWRLLPKPRDTFEAGLRDRMAELREELNWFYNQINRPPNSEAAHSTAAMAELHQAARQRETALLEITRQLQQRGGETFMQIEPLNIALLQRDLGADTALVEYFSLDGELLAFIVTGDRIQVVRGLGREEQAEAALTRLRYQIDALRYGAEQLRSHLDQLALRARHYLQALYDLLLRPIEQRLGTRRLVIVPHRALHYVPFHALHDGSGYVIERREVSLAPSASVLRHCLARPRRAFQHALLLGIPDVRTPHVHDEIRALAPLFATTTTLLDEQATLAALRDMAPRADVLHLACHGLFRPDSPLFSALWLADGWLTVRDAYSLDLHCGLVVLSACETGISAVAPGDELIGLARGFFSAGAPALLVSQWRVDDATTADLMARF
jgi:CHAT domain-containing protein/tetratricopeptide (TPR) repeat protein